MIHINIQNRFEELFNVSMNEYNVSNIMKTPTIISFGESKNLFIQLNNWKKGYKYNNDLESKALSCIFLKTFNYINI